MPTLLGRCITLGKFTDDVRRDFNARTSNSPRKTARKWKRSQGIRMYCCLTARSKSLGATQTVVRL